jgi:hypothetical protein
MSERDFKADPTPQRGNAGFLRRRVWYEACNKEGDN